MKLNDGLKEYELVISRVFRLSKRFKRDLRGELSDKNIPTRASLHIMGGAVADILKEFVDAVAWSEGKNFDETLDEMLALMRNALSKTQEAMEESDDNNQTTH